MSHNVHTVSRRGGVRARAPLVTCAPRRPARTPPPPVPVCPRNLLCELFYTLRVTRIVSKALASTRITAKSPKSLYAAVNKPFLAKARSPPADDGELRAGPAGRARCGGDAPAKEFNARAARNFSHLLKLYNRVCINSHLFLIGANINYRTSAT